MLMRCETSLEKYTVGVGVDTIFGRLRRRWFEASSLSGKERSVPDIVTRLRDCEIQNA